MSTARASVRDPELESEFVPGPPPDDFAEGSAPEGRHRKLGNYLLDTGLQLRLASYLIGVAVVLCAALGFMLYRAWRETSRMIALADPEIAESLARALAQADRWRLVLVACVLVLIVILLLAATVVITHRIAGPAFAIGRTCRRVADGKLSPPHPLRAGDLLVRLASDVAGMIDSLRAREERERDLLVLSAARLRDPNGDVEAVALELEALAAEKGTRIGS